MFIRGDKVGSYVRYPLLDAVWPQLEFRELGFDQSANTPMVFVCRCFFFSSRRRHTRFKCDWSSDVCSSDLSVTFSVVLENVTLHAEKLREERLMQELALAHEIQEGYLPDELEGFPDADFEIFGPVFPARQVAGDFFDFVKTPSRRLAFFLGDVSGKGLPAALHMIAVRTLNPGDTLLFSTDGILEAHAGKRLDMFGLPRILELVREFTPTRPLADCTDAAKEAIDRFTGSKELQDDLTLLVLRRLDTARK